MDKLLEFAVGTQSNTSEGVRRAVSVPFCLIVNSMY